MSDFHIIRHRWVLQALLAIDVQKATGPDEIPGRLLKLCAKQLSHPSTTLVRRIFQDSRWPDTWRLHWVQPLYKKGSPSLPGNYRGVHLTPILSKIAERTIGKLFLPYLESTNAYGTRQWAFRKDHSCRDLITLRMLNWILAAHNNMKTGFFLSDISGAFDRVESKKLLNKLEHTGISPKLLHFLTSFFQPRLYTVLVNGATSSLAPLENQVFQGTVLGPPCWNIFSMMYLL